MHDSMKQELEELERELRPHLSRYMSKSPKTEETLALIRRLQGEFNRMKEEPQQEPHPFQLTFNEKMRKPSLIKQLILQVQTYPKAFWLTSLILFAMLTLMGGVYTPGLFGNVDLFSFSVPLYLLISFSYNYKSWNREMRMVESITPFPPALLLLNRLLILIALTMVLGMIGSFYLSLMSQSYPLFPFLMHWLAPLLLTGGLLAFLIFRLGIVAGTITSLLAWGGWIYVKGRFLGAGGNIGNDWELQMEISLVLVGALLIALSYRRIYRHPMEAEGKFR
ncbi:MAG: hypothetical protein IMW85_01270 [Thermicanus sp.]|nr:hypothetical protein [Thermicanus sp.]